MAVWFTIEMHLMTGLTVKSEITDEVAKEMLAAEWRYAFHETGLDDRDKVARMIATQIAFAVEKRDGVFVLDGRDGEKWLFPNASIVAALLTDANGDRRRGMGFGQLPQLEMRDDGGQGASHRDT